MVTHDCIALSKCCGTLGQPNPLGFAARPSRSGVRRWAGGMTLR